jgi:CRP-like cAMP-binding protein
MALKDDIQLLSSVPLFGDLSLEQIKLIAFSAERLHLVEGETLFRPGETADCAYLIATGRISLTHKNRAGEDVVIGNPGSGSLLSELAMISPGERKYLAIAKEKSELICISRALFYRLLEEYPDVAVYIEAHIRNNFQQMATEVAALKHRFL